MLGAALTVLASAAIGIALPTIAIELGVSPSMSTWVVNAYLFATVVSLLPLAVIGDLYGHRRVFLAGVSLFGLASLSCAVAELTPWPFATLLISRALQGLGAAGVMAVNMALLRATHPLNRLGQGIGLNGMVVAATNALGPSVAGYILSTGTWQSLFAAFVAPAAIAFFAGRASLPQTLRGIGKFDPVSAMLQAGAVAFFILMLMGISNPNSLLALAASVGFGILFIRRELKSHDRLLPYELLKNSLFIFSFSAAGASFVAQMMALIAIPFLLNAKLGMTNSAIGLAMTPWPLAAMVIAPFAGWLSDRLSPAAMGFGGLVLAACGLLGVSLLDRGTPFLYLAIPMATIGVGFAFFTGPNVRVLMLATPSHRSGAVGGLLAVSRQTGQLIGSAIAGIWLAQQSIDVGSGHAVLTACVVAFFAAVLCLYKPKTALIQ